MLSCGNKTDRGANTAEILMSLAATAHQQARDFDETIVVTLAKAPLPQARRLRADIKMAVSRNGYEYARQDSNL